MTENDNKPISEMSPDEAWQARVIAAARTLNNVLSQVPYDGPMVTMDKCGAGWPEILVSKIRERFEWFDEAKQEERYNLIMKMENERK